MSAGERGWLVTGGCGFIGSTLVGRLVRDGAPGVRVIDDLSVGSVDDLRAQVDVRTVDAADVHGPPTGVELVVGDVREPELAKRVAAGTKVIVHLAGNTGVQPSIADPVADCVANVMGTLHYLEAARSNGVARFVFASSGGTVIGDCDPPIHEDMVPRPKAPYGASKSACEGYLSAYHGTFGIDTVALRFANVYGPGSVHKGSVVARFIRRAMAGEPLEVFGDGDQTRDFVYIADLVDAIVRSASVDGVGGNVFQIATSRETSVNELVELLLPELRTSVAPGATVRQAEALPGEIRRNFSDTSKAARMLGWSPSTTLEEGLTKTVEWFANRA